MQPPPLTPPSRPSIGSLLAEIQRSAYGTADAILGKQRMPARNCLGSPPDYGRLPRRPVEALGFTLIELLVTIAILAVLLALAVPAFTSLINSNRLAAQSNEVIASLQQARIESIKQNRRTTVCRSTNGTSCAGAAGRWTQWITYVDLNSNGAPSANEIVRVNTAKAPLQVTSTNHTLTFRADGMARNAAGALVANAMIVCIPTTEPAENQRQVRLVTGSRIALTPLNGAGACP